MVSYVDVVAPRRRALSQDGFFYLALVTTLLLAILLIERLFPIAYVHLISEDKIGEYATSVAFAAAGAFFAASGMRRVGRDRLFLFLMAFMSLFVAGEEISWGQRIFGIDTPEVVRAVNHQGEMTLHNIGPLQWASFHEVAGVLLQVLMLASALRNQLPKRLAWIGELSLPSLSLWPASLIVSYMLIMMPVVKGDEISEAFLAFMVLMWSMLTAFRLKVVAEPQSRRVTAVVAVLAAAAGVATILSATFGMNMGWRYNMTASRDYPNAGMMLQSRILYDHILSNPELVQEDTAENFRRLHQ